MTKREKHVFTEKRKALAAKTLAQKIGYLKAQDFPSSFFNNLLTQELNAHKVIRPDNELFVVEKGIVEIWRTQHDMLVTKLEPETIFGDMSLLGQTMLGCQAITGLSGASLGVVDVEHVGEWIDSNARKILEELGPRLAHIEADHYKAIFQAVDSRLAGLLLELVGAESTIQGFTHDELADQIGSYRETVTIALKNMKSDRIIEIGRKRLTILDKKALKELSEL
jgi:CRP/FNR family cyclic AMP-dependent transcriptional regulator